LKNSGQRVARSWGGPPAGAAEGGEYGGLLRGRTR
jgi:hypothetical protein